MRQALVEAMIRSAESGRKGNFVGDLGTLAGGGQRRVGRGGGSGEGGGGGGGRGSGGGESGNEARGDLGATLAAQETAFRGERLDRTALAAAMDF
jgi:hypothetical protein